MLTVSDIKELVKPVCRKYDVQEAYLFGSYARGEATDKSDVDIRIVRGNSPKLRSLFRISGFRLDLMDALDRDVDLLTCLPHGPLSEPFLQNLKKDEIKIYGDNP